jgi:RNA polymerase sigma-70 factor (ECF subfamily)
MSIRPSPALNRSTASASASAFASRSRPCSAASGWVEPADETPPWLEPFPDEPDDPSSPETAIERRESVEVAFVAAFQHLPAKERAVLLLRDVLGFTANETAHLLDTTVAAVTSRLQRARGRVRARLPEQSQRDTLRAVGDDRVRALVTAYVEAWERQDADAIVALATADAVFSMPPEPVRLRGRADIGRFLRDAPLRREWRLVPVRAGGQVAFGCYLREGGGWVAHSVDVVTLRGDRIERITAFNDARLPARFGLPGRLDG